MTVIVMAVVTALLIGWIVAASLGLGADGHPGVGPDRPPAPDLFRKFASAPTLSLETVARSEGLS